MNVEWHKWPEENPPTTGLYWVFCPSFRYQEASGLAIFRYVGDRRWRAGFYEDTDETRRVHSWAVIEEPRPPYCPRRVEQRWFVDGREATYDEAMRAIEQAKRSDA